MVLILFVTPTYCTSDLYQSKTTFQLLNFTLRSNKLYVRVLMVLRNFFCLVDGELQIKSLGWLLFSYLFWKVFRNFIWPFESCTVYTVSLSRKTHSEKKDSCTVYRVLTRYVHMYFVDEPCQIYVKQRSCANVNSPSETNTAKVTWTVDTEENRSINDRGCTRVSFPSLELEPPTPFPANEFAPPQEWKEGRDHSLARERLGGGGGEGHSDECRKA